MVEAIKTKIKFLPPLPESFHKIQKVCDGDYGIDDVAKAIEGDPMVVADLLKTANSPLYGFNRQIKNVLQAVSLFGKVMTKSLVMSSMIKGLLKMDVKPYGLTPEQFVRISNIQSAIAKAWFKNISKEVVEDLFLCALLQDTGKIILADEIIKQGKVNEFKNEIENTDDIGSVEFKYLGTTSILTTADIFDHWRFEQSMIDTIRYSNDPKTAPDDKKQLSSALHILRTLGNLKEPLSQNSIKLATEMAIQYGFDEYLLIDAIDKVKKS